MTIYNTPLLTTDSTRNLNKFDPKLLYLVLRNGQITTAIRVTTSRKRMQLFLEMNAPYTTDTFHKY